MHHCGGSYAQQTLTTVSALMLMAAPVLAQTTPARPRAAPHRPLRRLATMVAVKTPAPTRPRWRMSPITGSAVHGSDDSKIGSVSTVLMQPQNKTIDRMVVSAGGVLGVGGHKVAVPLDQFKWDSDKGGFKIAKTTDDLKSMPEWQSQTARATTD